MRRTGDVCQCSSTVGCEADPYSAQNQPPNGPSGGDINEHVTRQSKVNQQTHLWSRDGVSRLALWAMQLEAQEIMK